MCKQTDYATAFFIYCVGAMVLSYAVVLVRKFWTDDE